MRYRSSDGLMSSSDPEAVARWDEIGASMAADKATWTEILRGMGVRLAHPDDGWVKRDRNRFSMSWYPQFDDRPEVGDLMAFGCPPRYSGHYRARRVWSETKRTFTNKVHEPESADEGYRIVRCTAANRRHSIIGYQQDFEYEDTGLRVPPPPPPTGWRRLLRKATP